MDTSITRLLQLAHRALKHGDVPRGARTPQEALDRGVGLCSDFSLILADLLNQHGYEARLVGVRYRRPVNDTHVFVEIEADGGAMLDASANCYIPASTIDLLRQPDRLDQLVKLPLEASLQWGYRYVSPEYVWAISMVWYSTGSNGTRRRFYRARDLIEHGERAARPLGRARRFFYSLL